MSSINPINTVAALNDKLSWEDPCLVLERDLVARAQDGPPSGEQSPPWQQTLGMLSTSGGVARCR